LLLLDNNNTPPNRLSSPSIRASSTMVHNDDKSAFDTLGGELQMTDEPPDSAQPGSQSPQRRRGVGGWPAEESVAADGPLVEDRHREREQERAPNWMLG
jgi:hypothetical protein